MGMNIIMSDLILKLPPVSWMRMEYGNLLLEWVEEVIMDLEPFSRIVLPEIVILMVC